MNQLNKLLKDGRKKRRLSQVQFAKLLGYPNPQSVSNWERGASPPPSHQFEVMAESLGITFNELAVASTLDHWQKLHKNAGLRPPEIHIGYRRENG